MTREETVSLIRSIVSLYPNWKPDNLTDTVNAWHWALEEYPAPAVKAALQIYLKTNNSGFAPSVSQVIGSMYAIKENAELTEGEAWALVKKAIADGGYHSEERFAELPELVQKAVGGASMIRTWSMCSSEEVNTVISSNFQRTYRSILDKHTFGDKIPQHLIDEVMKIEQQGPKLIEGS